MEKLKKKKRTKRICAFNHRQYRPITEVKIKPMDSARLKSQRK